MMPQEDINKLTKSLIELKDRTRKQFIEIGAEMSLIRDKIERAEKDFYKAWMDAVQEIYKGETK